jgi:hypothetical protein
MPVFPVETPVVANGIPVTQILSANLIGRGGSSIERSND